MPYLPREEPVPMRFITNAKGETEQVSSGEVVNRLVRHVKLAPGLNLVPEDEFMKVFGPDAKDRAVGEPIADTRLVYAPPTKIPTVLALDVIRQTSSRSVLRHWLRSEKRSQIKQAIEAQLQRLDTPQGEDAE